MCTLRDLHTAIRQGSTVALQPLYNKRYWLGCPHNPCRGGTQGCPGLFMEGNDWTNCWGEVFQIYRESGPGTVKVGDRVGIYYPREPGKWLGCAGSRCGKATCPGRPTTHYGFQNRQKWAPCWGEVFKIYARGKCIGSDINAHDAIMLYYPRGRSWVKLDTTYVVKHPCPGRVFPPSPEKYDRCWGEVMEIWMRWTLAAHWQNWYCRINRTRNRTSLVVTSFN